MCRGQCGSVCRSTNYGLDEYDPTNAYNQPRDVHDPHDSCGRSVCIHFSVMDHPCQPGGRVASPGLEGGQVAILRLQRGGLFARNECKHTPGVCE